MYRVGRQGGWGAGPTDVSAGAPVAGAPSNERSPCVNPDRDGRVNTLATPCDRPSEHSTTGRAEQNPWTAASWSIAGGVALVLVVQIGSAASVRDRTAALRGVLAEGHAVAAQLERRIGYGGLVHDFKNYVLRPDEDRYRTSALANAEEALALLERLRASADRLGIDARLTHTREMIESYAARLERVRDLSANGRDPGFVDERVRFDDQPALQEVELVIAALDGAIDARLLELQRHGTLTTLLSTAGTAALGALLVAAVARRQRRHAEALGALADSLAESNVGLARANTALGQFAGIVSHDLKTPLRHINVFGALIVEDRDDAEAVERHVDGTSRLVGQMESMVDSLLDFTRAGFAQPRVERFELAALLAGIERDLHPELERGRAHLELDVELDETVLADPELLTRVFANLIGNSLKYARAETPARIVVRAGLEDGRLVCSVTDNGIGIDARFAEQIFEPLQRLHGPQSPYTGVGIGLSLARSIVESHGGSIRLDTDVTDGTRIVFSLPHARRAARGEAA